MELTISEKAQEWFKKEIQLEEGYGIRFYGKVYGSTEVHEGFSIGMSVEKPVDILIQKEIAGVLYFIEETDEWFFKGYDVTVDFDGKLKEPAYHFTENATR